MWAASELGLLGNKCSPKKGAWGREEPKESLIWGVVVSTWANWSCTYSTHQSRQNANAPHPWVPATEWTQGGWEPAPSVRCGPSYLRWNEALAHIIMGTCWPYCELIRRTHITDFIREIQDRNLITDWFLPMLEQRVLR